MTTSLSSTFHDGNAAGFVSRVADALGKEYADSTWKPTSEERHFAEDLARGALSGSRLREAFREAPPGRLAHLLTLVTPVFERVQADQETEELRLALRGLLDSLAPLP
ncbi:hypothetical protein ACPCTO_34920 [Streptomyces olivoreticuli]